MAIAIGSLIIAGLEAAGVAGGIAGLGTLGTITVFGVGLPTIIGSLAILAISIGLQYALRPSLPKPGDGQQSTRQQIPPRNCALGRVRLGGSYMLYETADNGDSIDVVALTGDKISGFVDYYLHDDWVRLDPLSQLVAETTFDDDRYLEKVLIDTRLGLPTETSYSQAISLVPEVWTTDHRGDGIASMMVWCKGVDSKDFQRFYPNQLPLPSAVIDGFELWDPRDNAQDPENNATFTNYPAWDVGSTYAESDRLLYGGVVYISRVDSNTGNQPDESPEQWVSVWSNPVIQLINYTINTNWGMGLRRQTLIDPVLDKLIVEANICDELVLKNDGSYEPRYRSDGFFTFDTDPSEVIGGILSTCDGWLTENGEGGLSLWVGKYRAPTVTLEARHIGPLSFDGGIAAESRINDLELSFTSPAHKYKEIAGQPWRDEEDISERGRTVSQNLSLTWVQSHSQARRLAKRTMAMLVSPMSGKLGTTLYGLVARGQRWIRVQYPDIEGLEDVVIEIKNAEFDLVGAKCTFDWKIINPNSIDAWDPATEEGRIPVLPDDLPSSGQYVPENVNALLVGNTISVSWDDPDRSEFTYAVQYRLVDDGTGSPGAWVTQNVTSPQTSGGSLVASIPVTEIKEYEIQVATVGTKGTYSDWSESVFADPPETETATLLAAFTTAPTDLRKAYINRLVKDLKGAGVWSKFDLLYLLAAHDAQAGRVNWVAPGSHNLTVIGSPVFTVDQGYKGATSSYLDSGVAASALSKYKQNDAVIGIWTRTAIVETLGAISSIGGGIAARIIPAITSTSTSSYLNNATSTTVAGAGGVGHHAVSRSASGSYTYYKNGASAGTASQASTGVPSGNVFVLRDTGGTSSTQQLALAYVGQSLTSTEVLAAHNAFAKFLSAIGAA